MKKKLFCIFLLSLFISSKIFPEKNHKFVIFPFDSELSQFIQNYHKNPNPKFALNDFFSLELNKFELKAKRADQPHSRAILMAFYTHVLFENPDLVVPFAKKTIINQNVENAAFATEIIAHGASQNREIALNLIFKRFNLKEKHRNTLLNLPIMPYTSMEINHWQMLDIFWAAYYGSMNIHFLEKIIDTLEYWQIQDEKFKTTVRNLANANLKQGSKQYIKFVNMVNAQAAHMALTYHYKQFPLIQKDIKLASNKKNAKIRGIIDKLK